MSSAFLKYTRHIDKDHGYDLAAAFLVLCGEIFSPTPKILCNMQIPRNLGSFCHLWWTISKVILDIIPRWSMDKRKVEEHRKVFHMSSLLRDISRLSVVPWPELVTRSYLYLSGADKCPPRLGMNMIVMKSATTENSEGWQETWRLAFLRLLKLTVENLNYSILHGKSESFIKISLNS